ncbi:MAG: molybdenum cofactor biosynthesis protein MoaE [Bacteroidia bacterium]
MEISTLQIVIQETPIRAENAINFVSRENCGGISVFVGTVRNATQGRAVIRLEFEAYEKMALREMEKIAAEAQHRFSAGHVAIHHRTGTLLPGEIAVVIAVSTPHRAAAFAACQYAIDTLKQTVPIWKKEIFADGEVWVSAHP